MKRVLLSALFLLLAGSVWANDYRSGIDWKEPVAVTPGERSCDAPADAIILFDGSSLDAWEGGPWDIIDNEMVIVAGNGDIKTKQKFGSVQLHLEFMISDDVPKDPYPGNSGIFLMNHYELQILDSFENRSIIYFDGQCGSLYKQSPPLVNVSKPPLKWQSFDVVFTRPLLKTEENKVVEVLRPAFITVFQNGVLVQNHFELKGDTFYHKVPEYVAHGDKESISIQDHGYKLRFRNIWVREIPDSNNVPTPARMPYFADQQ